MITRLGGENEDTRVSREIQTSSMSSIKIVACEQNGAVLFLNSFTDINRLFPLVLRDEVYWRDRGEIYRRGCVYKRSNARDRKHKVLRTTAFFAEKLIRDIPSGTITQN